MLSLAWRPQDDARTLLNQVRTQGGGELRLVGGEYPGGVYAADIPNLTLSVIKPSTFSGGTHALKFEGCNKLIVRCGVGAPLTLTQADENGLMLVGCRNVQLLGHDGAARIRALGNGNTGILTADCRDLLAEWVEGSDSRRQHGLYFSQSGTNLTLRDGVFERNARTGCQINGHSPDAEHSFIRGLTLQRLLLVGNQHVGGAAALNLAAVQGGRVEQVDVQEHLGRNAVAVWDDTAGKPYFCRDIAFTGGRWQFAATKKRADADYLNIAPGCERITCAGVSFG